MSKEVARFLLGFVQIAQGLQLLISNDAKRTFTDAMKRLQAKTLDPSRKFNQLFDFFEPAVKIAFPSSQSLFGQTWSDKTFEILAVLTGVGLLFSGTGVVTRVGNGYLLGMLLVLI